jgi:hypothetical protein
MKDKSIDPFFSKWISEKIAKFEQLHFEQIKALKTHSLYNQKRGEQNTIEIFNSFKQIRDKLSKETIVSKYKELHKAHESAYISIFQMIIEKNKSNWYVQRETELQHLLERYLSKELLEWIIANLNDAKSNIYSMQEVALIIYFNELKSEKNMFTKYASDYGWTSANSGQKLYQEFTNACSKSTRLNPDYDSQKVISNMIERLEKILPVIRNPTTIRAEIDNLKELILTRFNK